MYRPVLLSLCLCHVFCAIRENTLLNKLIKVKPVGNEISKKFVPLTEIPPPQIKPLDGRRHMPEECTKRPGGKDIIEGGQVDIIGEDYDDGIAKTMATVIIPDHIDYKHFQVTSPVPYLTVGSIEAIGYHHTTSTLNECEKIYQDHMEEMYSDEDTDYSEESLEMAKMPVDKMAPISKSLEALVETYYGDV